MRGLYELLCRGWSGGVYAPQNKKSDLQVIVWLAHLHDSNLLIISYSLMAPIDSYNLQLYSCVLILQRMVFINNNINNNYQAGSGPDLS